MADTDITDERVAYLAEFAGLPGTSDYEVRALARALIESRRLLREQKTRGDGLAADLAACVVQRDKDMAERVAENKRLQEAAKIDYYRDGAVLMAVQNGIDFTDDSMPEELEDALRRFDSERNELVDRAEAAEAARDAALAELAALRAPVADAEIEAWRKDAISCPEKSRSRLDPSGVVYVLALEDIDNAVALMRRPAAPQRPVQSQEEALRMARDALLGIVNAPQSWGSAHLRNMANGALSELDFLLSSKHPPAQEAQ